MDDKLKIFLDPAPGGALLGWACRGKGKCLEPEPGKRRRHCEDCVLTRPQETIEQLLARMEALPDPE